jgi:hypothetical protein
MSGSIILRRVADEFFPKYIDKKCPGTFKKVKKDVNVSFNFKSDDLYNLRTVKCTFHISRGYIFSSISKRFIGKYHPHFNMRTANKAEKELIKTLDIIAIYTFVYDLINSKYAEKQQALTFLLCYRTTPYYHKDIAAFIIKKILFASDASHPRCPELVP